MARISVKGDRFVDNQGRHVILRGINLVHKGNWENGIINYIPSWDERVFSNLKKWGFNLVRLGIIWDAVEPRPGEYDEKYLDWVNRMLDLCEKYGIYAYLDMHQDLYSVLYSDGAPEWATITDSQPHIEGDIWSDAYIISDAVKRSFDNFWNNTPASDGVGLQDHYVNMWVHIAKRFAGHPALIGYDFLNEPFPGTQATAIFEALVSSLKEALSQAKGTHYAFEEVMEMLSHPEGKIKILDFIEDKKIYQSVAKAVEPLVEKFDKGALDGFYRKISQAVRTVDRDTIIMRENSYFSNIGIECKAQPIVYENGTREPQQAFSPHGYDLVVDTEGVQWASNNRIDVIFDAHRRTQQRMGVPVMVGEWGAHGDYSEGLYHIEHILQIFDKYMWSSTYWCFYDGFENTPVLGVLKRPFPQAVCGRILHFRYDYQSKRFYMEWDEENGHAPTIIYLPQKEFEVENIKDFSVERMGQSSLVVIEPTGRKRSISISL
ncbi:MAG: cellulase family glycosylhydrolase [Caldicoprobacterales bacterium]|nr:cellulase family glycosylhydrolase [Clostridiales bacterium]